MLASDHERHALRLPRRATHPTGQSGTQPSRSAPSQPSRSRTHRNAWFSGKSEGIQGTQPSCHASHGAARPDRTGRTEWSPSRHPTPVVHRVVHRLWKSRVFHRFFPKLWINIHLSCISAVVSPADIWVLFVTVAEDPVDNRFSTGLCTGCGRRAGRAVDEPVDNVGSSERCLEGRWRRATGGRACRYRGTVSARSGGSGAVGFEGLDSRARPGIAGRPAPDRPAADRWRRSSSARPIGSDRIGSERIGPKGIGSPGRRSEPGPERQKARAPKCPGLCPLEGGWWRARPLARRGGHCSSTSTESISTRPTWRSSERSSA